MRQVSLPHGPMLTKTKKKSLQLKNAKFETRKKWSADVWWIVTYPQNLALIHLTVSEKKSFMDGRWILAPYGISSAGTVK